MIAEIGRTPEFGTTPKPSNTVQLLGTIFNPTSAVPPNRGRSDLGINEVFAKNSLTHQSRSGAVKGTVFNQQKQALGLDPYGDSSALALGWRGKRRDWGRTAPYIPFQPRLFWPPAAVISFFVCDSQKDLKAKPCTNITSDGAKRQIMPSDRIRARPDASEL